MSSPAASTAVNTFNPHNIPVAQVDRHLAALQAGQLTPQHLRRRLERAASWSPVIQGDAARLDLTPTRPPAPAAVLLALMPAATGGLNVLLTRRTAHLKHHAGQISFPGGKREPDDHSPEATALREAHEEVGLAPHLAEVWGRLPAYRTVTGFEVTPVIAMLPQGLVLVPEPGEVAEVFEVPLPFLMNPAHHRWHEHEWQGHRRRFLSMPWHNQVGQEYFIWGATASMLRNFYHLLASDD